MNRYKLRVLQLMLFGSVTLASMFLGATLLAGNASENKNLIVEKDSNMLEEDVENQQDGRGSEDINVPGAGDDINVNKENGAIKDQAGNQQNVDNEEITELEGTADSINAINPQEIPTLNIKGEPLKIAPERELIVDYTQIEYKDYIPQLVNQDVIKEELNITNPSLDIKAEAAILFDANTKEILYYKNPVLSVFPASTSKLLTALTALDWCDLEEEVTVGEEASMIASDSTRANIYKGQILTIENLLMGMLLPSGNDAAYVIASYVGRIALNQYDATADQAITKFVELMNEKAESLGVVYSCFKTPDGYDALGQYTTAYDMGLIGIAAMENEVITNITKKSSCRNRFISGQDITWNNTNALVSSGGSRYYPYSLGLKTGTSTMAGKCLVSAAKKKDREVVSVVMNSTSAGRWSDSITLLDYGLTK